MWRVVRHGCMGRPRVLQPAPSTILFEVHARRAGRWLIETTAASAGIAHEQAQELLLRPDVDGIRIWQEIHDPETRRTAGRTVLMEEKPRPKRRGRARSRALPAHGKDAAAHKPARRQAAAPQERPGDHGLALTTIVSACAALVALAAIAASN